MDEEECEESPDGEHAWEYGCDDDHDPELESPHEEWEECVWCLVRR